MDAIVQGILNKSKLEVSLIRITNPTEDTFTMEIESRTTNTGVAPAVLAPMTVEMVGPKGVFGYLDLPEVKTNSKGADVNIPAQHIKITDLDAYKAYSKSIQLDEDTSMYLDNGKGTIKALGFLSANIVYKKEVEMKAMDGPMTEILKTEVTGPDTFKNTMKITNPSPVEIDMGPVTMQYKNASGQVLAEQTADIFIRRGETIYEATGKVVAKGDISSVSLVGGSELTRKSWISHTLEIFDVPIPLSDEMHGLLSG